MYAAYFVATSCLIWKDRASSGPRHDFVTHQLQKKHPCRLAGYCGAIRSSDAFYSMRRRQLTINHDSRCRCKNARSCTKGKVIGSILVFTSHDAST